MRSLRIWTMRFLSLFRKRQLEARLDEELGFHLEMQAREHEARGMSPQAARRAARLARRTNEIGLRMALGAPRGQVLGLVMRETARLIAIGVAAGLAGALALTRVAASQLFGVSAHDPATVLTATLAMAAVALAAGFLPARRAADTDPMAALRYE